MCYKRQRIETLSKMICYLWLHLLEGLGSYCDTDLNFRTVKFYGTLHTLTIL